LRKGKVVGTFGISRDITGRKQAEKLLKAAKEAAEAAKAKKRAEEDLDSVMHKVDTADEAALPLSGKVADSNPSTMMADRELEHKLHEALDQLPEIHRQVILLREVENLSYSDIASVLEISKGTVMSRLHHARRKLKELLEPYLGPPGTELDDTHSPGDRMQGREAMEDEA